MQSGIPLIAVSFGDRSPGALIEKARAAGLDIAELRIDRFDDISPAHVISEVRRFADLPTIATIRSRGEGGSWPGTEEARLGLFLSVVHDVDAVDIELSSHQIRDSVIEAVRGSGRVSIVSFHDFEMTPPLAELRQLAEQAKAAGADYVKISTMARSDSDVQRLAQFTIENKELGLITIAMGSKGALSRIFFPALGSRLTYAHLESEPAPGQLSFPDTLAYLRTFYGDVDREKAGRG